MNRLLDWRLAKPVTINRFTLICLTATALAVITHSILNP